MARDRKRHAQEKELLIAGASDTAMSPNIALVTLAPPPYAAKPSAQSPKNDGHSRAIQRIQSCLSTVAMLLETSDEFLPIFLRLEQELEAEQMKRDAIKRAKTYVAHGSVAQIP